MIYCTSVSLDIIGDSLSKQKRKQKYNTQNFPEVSFLEDCADDCAVNGDMLLREFVFVCCRDQWNCRFLG